MAPSRPLQPRFCNRKIRPFLGRSRRTFFKHAAKRKPFRVTQVEPRPVQAAAQDEEAAGENLENVAINARPPLYSPQYEMNTSFASNASTAELPVYDGPGYVVTRGEEYLESNESAIASPTPRYSISEDDRIPGPAESSAIATSLMEPEEEEGEGVVSLWTNSSGCEAGASDMDEPMPEPMQPNRQVKLITLDHGSALVVVDPVSFHSQVAMISGCVNLLLVHGNLQLNGYEMTVGKTVKACTGGSKDCILFEGSMIARASQQLLNKAIRTYVDAKFAAQVIREISAFDGFPDLTVVLITKWEDNRLSLIQAHLSPRLPDPSQYLNKPFFELVFGKNYSCIGPDWMELIAHKFLMTMSNESLLLVTGPSESGKSVLLKRIINLVMSEPSHFGATEKLLFIDLDPGQTEFSPPAQITAVEILLEDEPLISRSYAHSVIFQDRIVHRVSVGSTNLSACASVYVGAIEHLMSTIRDLYKEHPCPMFVNTSGFITGLGRCLLIDAIRLVQPTDVIEIKDSLDNNNDCRYDVVFGPRARGYITRLESSVDRRPYGYIDLKSTGRRHRPKGVNLKNRESQILAALSTQPDFFLTPLSKLDRIPVDYNRVIHFTTIPNIPIASLIQRLHHAFVQLVATPKEDASDTLPRGVCTTSQLCPRNLILGYGVLFVSRDELGQDWVELAASCDLNQDVDCIVVPDGVSLPSLLLV